MTPTRTAPLASVVIPAHDEERTIGRLLTQLTAGCRPNELDIIVVCNGCSDQTASVAATFAPLARVIEIPTPSKFEAIRAGDRQSHTFPRLYVDADVEITRADVVVLAQRLSTGDVLACAPDRHLTRSGVKPLVSRYYDVWERLPQVQSGMFGRGVIAVSEAGHQRIRDLPHVMSDDLVISESFSADERCVLTTAHVVVHPARTLRDLLRRRVRVASGNVEALRRDLVSPSARTKVAGLIELAFTEPAVRAGLPVFAAVTAAARLLTLYQSRLGTTKWHRDESSRQPL